MPKRETAVCLSCGKKVEYTPCGQRRVLPEDARCKVLDGWLTVSHWKDMHSIEEYDFCSLTCLQKWVEAQAPKVPNTFLDAFRDE